MTAAGDLTIGGSGSITGYEQLTVPAAAGVTSASSDGAATPANALNAIDGVFCQTLGMAGQWWRADFGVGVSKAVGRFRVVQWPSQGATRATSFRLQSSPDATAWTTVYTWTGGDTASDTGVIDITVPVTGRYFRMLVDAGGAGNWALDALQLWGVTTVGAGNGVRLAAGAELRLLRITLGVPAYAPPGANIADLGAAPGIDVAAVTGTQVVTKAEHDLTIAKVNALLTALEAFGILAP